MWTLWNKSDADTQEKWRDLSRLVRHAAGDDEEYRLAELLQMVYWFGAVCATSGDGSRGEGGFRTLLPESTLKKILRRSPERRTPGPARGSKGSTAGSQKEVRASELETFLSKGWRFVAPLGRSRVILECPGP